MGQQGGPIVNRLRHEGFGGYHCYFCDQKIKKLPYVMLQKFKEYPDGTQVPIDTVSQQAHPGCAERAGLKKFGDEIDA